MFAEGALLVVYIDIMDVKSQKHTSDPLSERLVLVLP